MVKGCQKKTIHIKDTGSKYYEEAYFVLRPGFPDSSSADADMIGEAMRIAGESISPGAKRRVAVLKGKVLSFVLGFAAGALAALIVCLSLSL